VGRQGPGRHEDPGGRRRRARPQGAARRRHGRDPLGAGGADPRVLEAGQTFYAQQGNAGAPGDGDGQPQGDGQPAGATAGRADDVVEADYEIVDDKK
jgi:hypothetical protein